MPFFHRRTSDISSFQLKCFIWPPLLNCVYLPLLSNSQLTRQHPETHWKPILAHFSAHEDNEIIQMPTLKAPYMESLILSPVLPLNRPCKVSYGEKRSDKEGLFRMLLLAVPLRLYFFIHATVSGILMVCTHQIWQVWHYQINLYYLYFLLGNIQYSTLILSRVCIEAVVLPELGLTACCWPEIEKHFLISYDPDFNSVVIISVVWETSPVGAIGRGSCTSIIRLRTLP